MSVNPIPDKYYPLNEDDESKEISVFNKIDLSVKIDKVKNQSLKEPLLKNQEKSEVLEKASSINKLQPQELTSDELNELKEMLDLNDDK
ncbi:MAG: hypothetical protein WD595_05285 [Waddliaceae bacterium]